MSSFSLLPLCGASETLKPNYFKKQHSSSTLLFTQGNNTGQKWQWSTQKASFMSKMHGTSPVSTPGQFGPVLLS